MAWEKIFGHERIKKILQRAITGNRVAHSYCFWGPDGVGKEAMAIQFAKVLNCQSPVMGNTSENQQSANIDACGKCKSCLQIARLQHPNLQLIYSMPAGKSTDSKSDEPLAKLSEEQLKTIQAQIALKAENNYHKILIPNANQIKISSIREIKKNLTYYNSQAGRRVVIVCSADEMTPEAANAFLKTLEEPHENITIIITTSKKDSLLPTILSRCQHIRFQPLQYEIIKKYLVEIHNQAESQANIISLFAQGSVTKALDFLDSNIQQLRMEAVDVLRTSLKKNVYRIELLKYIENFIKRGDKKHIEAFLNLIMFWLRDTYEMSRSGSNYKIVNVDQTEILKKFVTNFGKKNLSGCMLKIQDSITLLKKNVNPQLILIALFLYIRKNLLV